jgi:hypothetical protein
MRNSFRTLFLATVLTKVVALSDNLHSRRRIFNKFVLGTSVLLASSPSLALADNDKGTRRIQQAITTSPLGLDVRRSVVQGAQVIDQLDARWERFSDKYGLGRARNQRAKRPAPKDIPPLQPLDSDIAARLVQLGDDAFCASANVIPTQLKEQIARVQSAVGPSFERAGLLLPTNQIPTTALQYNYLIYTHYKAYTDLYMQLQQHTDFSKFKRAFETQLGKSAVQLLTGSSPRLPIQSSSDYRCAQLQQAFDTMDMFSKQLVSNGFVASIDTNTNAIDQDDKMEWCTSSTIQGDELAWSIALDGDATLDAQLLLQEQGFRLYPNVARCGIQYILQCMLHNVTVSMDDYYMDTDYSSDPDAFSVRAVLLNVLLER